MVITGWPPAELAISVETASEANLVAETEATITARQTSLVDAVLTDDFIAAVAEQRDVHSAEHNYDVEQRFVLVPGIEEHQAHARLRQRQLRVETVNHLYRRRRTQHGFNGADSSRGLPRKIV